MAKTLIEQMNELKAKIKKEEKTHIQAVLATFDLMEEHIDELAKEKDGLMPGEILSEQLNNVLIVYTNVRSIFEQHNQQNQEIVTPLDPLANTP